MSRPHMPLLRGLLLSTWMLGLAALLGAAPGAASPPKGEPAPCAVSPEGHLNAASPRWHRVSAAATDVNCGATTTGTLPGLMPWDVVRVRCESPTLLTVQLDPVKTTIQDTVLAVYCTPFDARQPEAQLIAFNDDLPGLGKLSGFDAANGLLLPAGTYALVVSTAGAIDPAGAGDFGAYGLCLGEGITVVPPGEEPGPPDTNRYHSADLNRDYRISYAEFIRVIELFENTSTKTSDSNYSCVTPSTATEDGYSPDPSGSFDCPPHDADYAPQDWKISLSEALRVYQLTHYGYSYCPEMGTEDGFCPGTTK